MMSAKSNKNKGFTLAELLIVVAIIAVLVAVAIPVFTAQLKKAQLATDEANARALCAELSANYMMNGKLELVVFTSTDGGSHWGDGNSNGSFCMELDGNNEWTVQLRELDGTTVVSEYKFSKTSYGIIIGVSYDSDNLAPGVGWYSGEESEAEVIVFGNRKAIESVL